MSRPSFSPPFRRRDGGIRADSRSQANHAHGGAHRVAPGQPGTRRDRRRPTSITTHTDRPHSGPSYRAGVFLVSMIAGPAAISSTIISSLPFHSNAGDPDRTYRLTLP